MKISPRITRQPLARSSTPSYMRTDSFLIQTDGRFDTSIRYNRIIEDPYRRNTNSALKPFLVVVVAISLLASVLLFPERLGFSSLPLAVSDRKYFGLKPNNTGSSSIEEEESEVVYQTPNDDNIEEFRGDGDDDYRGIESDAYFEEGQLINNSSGVDNRNDTLGEEASDAMLIKNAGNYTNDNGGSGDDSLSNTLERKSGSKGSEDENEPRRR
ncbi:hypothetical protein ACHAW5_002086 [Stephanodiscus triporus]|uniref:Transmembrane protein n=1 Tax=Stephanodiscus triporus TaxID=2934178 RepID=A0ABD3MTQ0_9STRA